MEKELTPGAIKLADFIHQRRRELTLLQRELGSLVGCSASFIALLETKRSSFTIQKWPQFAKALQVSPPDFLKMVIEAFDSRMLHHIEFIKRFPVIEDGSRETLMKKQKNQNKALTDLRQHELKMYLISDRYA